MIRSSDKLINGVFAILFKDVIRISPWNSLTLGLEYFSNRFGRSVSSMRKYQV
jgi:hypothetical protein